MTWCWLLGHKYNVHVGTSILGLPIMACERCLKKKAIARR